MFEKYPRPSKDILQEMYKLILKIEIDYLIIELRN